MRSVTYYDNRYDFSSIDELIYHETLDHEMIPILDYVKMLIENREIPEEKITPPELSESLERDGIRSLQLVDEIKREADTTHTSILSELKDIQTWSYLSLYFAEKLKAGVLLQLYREKGGMENKNASINHLRNALDHWEMVVALTEDRYRPVPHVSIPEDQEEYRAFSWAWYLPQVKRDLDIAESAVYKE